MPDTLTPDVIATSHVIADYESVVTAAARTIDRQVSLLTDALHALRNGSPDVTAEFLNRSIDALIDARQTIADRPRH
jgi:hypothetical protein